MSDDRYWRSGVSEIADGSVFIRGYRLDDLIGASFTSTTYLLIRGELPTPEQTRVLDAVLTAVLDYALEKPGTTAARFVVSSNPNMQAGLATAVLAAGDYSLSPEATARFALKLHDEFIASGSADKAAFAQAAVERMRQRKERIPGLGHPVFKKVDPRAQALRKIAVDAGMWTETADLYEAVHVAFAALPGKAEIPINDVGMIALLCVNLGFTPEESTALAVLGTLPGVVAHISEELSSGRPIRVVPNKDVEYDVPRRAAPTSVLSCASDDSTRG
ncbi:citryl-CoA lyase [Streptomyces sp. NPDC005708]|uniref:citryl-CoA lyase n=1 Tax=Streptomyces sp. NPDC005708 TaxID=3154564 RepID=UPI0033E63A86